MIACIAVVILVSGEGSGRTAALLSAAGASSSLRAASVKAPTQMHKVLAVAAAQAATATGPALASKSGVAAGAHKGAVAKALTADKIAEAEVKRVLEEAFHKAALHASKEPASSSSMTQQALAHAPGKKAAAGKPTDAEVRKAAEAEAEKDAITAGEADAEAEPTAKAKKAAPAGPNQPKDEGKYDSTGLKKKAVPGKVKAKPIKLSKGVLEAMKTGLEAGWAEERRAKKIAKEEAAVFYAKLREKMLEIDEKRHEKEVGELAARRNQTASQGNSYLLNVLDKVYQKDGPTPKEVTAHNKIKFPQGMPAAHAKTVGEVEAYVKAPGAAVGGKQARVTAQVTVDGASKHAKAAVAAKAGGGGIGSATRSAFDSAEKGVTNLVDNLFRRR